MGEIWVSESGQVGRVWAIRRKRKDFHILYFFLVEYLCSWVIFHGTNGSRLASNVATMSSGAQPGGNSGRTERILRRVGLFSGGWTTQVEINEHK